MHPQTAIPPVPRPLPKPAPPRLAEERKLVEQRLAPDPRAVVAAFRDLGLSLAEIARYFGVSEVALSPLLAE